MDTLSTHESKILTHVKKLNVVIHPLWAIQPFTKDAVRFDKERNELARSITQRMVATEDGELTLIMPLVIESMHEKSLRKSIVEAKKASEFIQWPDLYRNVIQKVGHGRNTLLGRNIVPNDIDKIGNPYTLEIDLRKRGFVIDDTTEIIVGGEMLNACLRKGIFTLFEIPQIKRIKVDTKCILDGGYLFGSDLDLKESNYQTFEDEFKRSGFEITKSGDYYNIQRK